MSNPFHSRIKLPSKEMENQAAAQAKALGFNLVAPKVGAPEPQPGSLTSLLKGNPVAPGQVGVPQTSPPQQQQQQEQLVPPVHRLVPPKAAMQDLGPPPPPPMQGDPPSPLSSDAAAAKALAWKAAMSTNIPVVAPVGGLAKSGFGAAPAGLVGAGACAGPPAGAMKPDDVFAFLGIKPGGVPGGAPCGAPGAPLPRLPGLTPPGAVAGGVAAVPGLGGFLSNLVGKFGNGPNGSVGKAGAAFGPPPDLGAGFVKAKSGAGGPPPGASISKANTLQAGMDGPSPVMNKAMSMPVFGSPPGGLPPQVGFTKAGMPLGSPNGGSVPNLNLQTSAKSASKAAMGAMGMLTSGKAAMGAFGAAGMLTQGKGCCGGKGDGAGGGKGDGAGAGGKGGGGFVAGLEAGGGFGKGCGGKGGGFVGNFGKDGCGKGDSKGGFGMKGFGKGDGK